MSGPTCISGEELTYLASTLAIAIAKELDSNAVALLSSFFSAVGDNLGIIAAQRVVCASLQDRSEQC